MNLLKSDSEVEEDEISKIENIDNYINSLTPEEIITKTPIFQKICNEKIKEVQELFSIIEEKESKLNNLPNFINSSQGLNLCTNNYKNTNYNKVPTNINLNISNKMNNNSNVNSNNNINNTNNSQLSQREQSSSSLNNYISKMDQESLQREHNQQISELETEYKKKLEKELEKLENDHIQEMTELRKDYEKKTSSLTEDISKMKEEVEAMKENKEQYITKEEHKNKLLKIFEEKSKEIELCDNEINKIENEIKEQYPSLIKNFNINDKEIKDIELPTLDLNSIQDENFGSKVDCFMQFIKKLQEKDKDKITLISSIDKANNKTSFNSKATDSDYGSNDYIECDEGEIVPEKKIIFFKSKFFNKNK